LLVIGDVLAEVQSAAAGCQRLGRRSGRRLMDVAAMRVRTAHKLGIAHHTVDKHRERILAKTKAVSWVELTIICLRLGIISTTRIVEQRERRSSNLSRQPHR
jgi:hypothetical protein